MIFLLTLGGFMAGTMGGLLGIGGGVLIMPILRFGVGLEPAYAAGTCIVAVFFTTLGGSFRHFKLGHIDFRALLPVIISGILSSLLFSLIFIYFTKKDILLDVATGLVFSLVALRMILEGMADYQNKIPESDNKKSIQGKNLTRISIGGLAGILPGLLGIGTGAILVPAFAFALNSPIKVAIGSSLACFSLNALVSSVLKIFQGFVQLNVLIPMCLGTLTGSQLGAALNGRVSSPFLKIMFGLVFVYVAFKYLTVLRQI